LPDAAEPSVRRDDDTALALDGLEEHADRVLVDRRGERFRVAERHAPESRREGTESLAVLILGAEPDDGRGAAVEVVPAHDDLGPAVGDALLLVAPLPDQLDRRLDRLGSRVHRERLLVAR